MATPALIDTDMGIDDAVALCLLGAHEAVDVRAIVGVGGNVEIDQVMKNIARVLDAIAPKQTPAIGIGLDQTGAALMDRRASFGHDGLGECELGAGAPIRADPFQDVYRRALESAADDLTILATGPLTNLAAVYAESPDLLRRARRIVISGGAVWTAGNVRGLAEFNFYRDPPAAARILASGLPLTVVPLDVTRLVCLDESHAAHIASSGFRTGQLLARVLRHCLDHESEPGLGKSHVQDAVAAASILWPDLFLKTRTRLEVVTAGPEAGRCRPQLGSDPQQRVDLLTAVNAVDLLENLLESLCHEAFVV